MPGVMIYDSNNSGGSWWLKDADWDALEAAGWTVHWGQAARRQAYADTQAEALLPSVKGDERWLGGLATSAAKRFDSKRDAVDEWERITGQEAAAIGCNCCGPPHSWKWLDDNGTKDYIYVDEPSVGYLDLD